MEGPERRSWSESISVASTDAGRCRYRRSASVSCLRPGRPEVRRREGVRLGLAPTPSAFAESVLCYVGGAIGTSASSSSRRHRSTVKYQGVGLRARRYSETCFVLPTSSVRHLSHVEAHPFVDASRRWYTAALKLVPRHNSVPESPASPASADWSSLRHSVTSPWAADDNNNQGANEMRRCHCQSEKVAGDKCTTFRSRVVVHV